MGQNGFGGISIHYAGFSVISSCSGLYEYMYMRYPDDFHNALSHDDNK